MPRFLACTLSHTFPPPAPLTCLPGQDRILPLFWLSPVFVPARPFQRCHYPQAQLSSTSATQVANLSSLLDVSFFQSPPRVHYCAGAAHIQKNAAGGQKGLEHRNGQWGPAGGAMNSREKR